MKKKKNKRLGIRQLELLEKLGQGLVVRMVHDYRRQLPAYCFLEDDEGINTYERVSCNLIQSLHNRNLVTVQEEMRIEGMDYLTFRLHKSNNPTP